MEVYKLIRMQVEIKHVYTTRAQVWTPQELLDMYRVDSEV